MEKINYLFPSNLTFNHQNGECLGQNIACHSGEEGDFNIGDELEINGNRVKISNLELVPSRNLPEGFGKTYRVHLQ